MLLRVHAKKVTIERLGVVEGAFLIIAVVLCLQVRVVFALL